MDKPQLNQGEDYERGFIDGMQYQRRSSVDKIVVAEERERLTDAAMKAAEKGIDTAIALEREACAKIVEEHAKVYAKLEKNPATNAAWAACIDIHDSISERGEQA